MRFRQRRGRFEENKGWASSPVAKCIRSQMICMTHNLRLSMEELLESAEQIKNQPELARRAGRLTERNSELARDGLKLPFVCWQSNV